MICTGTTLLSTFHWIWCFKLFFVCWALGKHQAHYLFVATFCCLLTVSICVCVCVCLIYTHTHTHTYIYICCSLTWWYVSLYFIKNCFTILQNCWHGNWIQMVRETCLITVRKQGRKELLYDMKYKRKCGISLENAGNWKMVVCQ